MAKAPVFVQSALLPAQQLDLVARVEVWQESAKRLAEAVEEERENRKYVIEHWFPEFEEGTHTGALSNGYNLKCDMRINRTVDQDSYQRALDYSKTNWSGAPRLRTLLERVFRVKMELNLGEWRELDESERRTLADIVIEKPGMPGLRYEEKKK